MFVTVNRDNDPKEHFRLFLAGIAFIATIAVLIALSIGIYNKTFTRVTTLTLQADQAGLQLPKYGDVRYNGVLVGQVRGISQSGNQAVIRLGLNPDDARRIPVDVEANILPTTLFGQKYVALVATPGGAVGIKDGTVLPSSRVHTAVELNKVLSRLFPLLRAVRPADLSTTLGALATALNGRGEAIGESLDKLDAYLTTINVHLPTLREDLRLLASVSAAYNVAAPDLVAALGNLTVTSKTIRAKKAGINGLFKDLTKVSILGAEIMERNEVNIIRAGEVSVPTLALLDKYAPEYDCLLRGIARYKPVLRKTFSGGVVKQYVEFPSPQVRGYDQRDKPVYADKRGPRCLGLPNNPADPWPGYDTANGTNLDSASGRGNSYSPGGARAMSFSDAYGGVLGGPTAYSAADASLTPWGQRAATARLAARTGRPAADIPGLSALLYGAMADSAGGAG